MLVLSRKKDESIMIGDQVEIKILAVEGDQIKLGIVAPKTVKVHRSEVFEAIQAENKEALSVTSNFLEQLKKK
ncbi:MULTISPECIES: carbon storage regulator CsrA [Lysinibacillus]|jgi:carbon storage regulator|uniref:Translational regulator CsrA n=1 Tax=Lysinibacillus fusiformis TaxID=28031 RepID=A0A2I0V5S4_9BACI|nr:MULTISPECIES: carbon storage regulator CsrA [Lysinibacillus]PKU53628.1 carbon storage regulator [Lysinibacillus fusiformis]WCH48411.1 carbon storage regulator CsrA [Lysinibacillus sp. OF-1]SCZ07873.1 carbon storage regulator, CsrA [Lysinibacillus sp. SG9]SDB52998.1 carbon storage regulator, CsrA [Lysinibacillus sp. TC-37]SFT16996.1 carbon storage regulator, CsrA [Lysinibacillus sp. SG55]